MMGLQAAPERLFYDFCLEDHVPEDHQLRQIDRFLDLGDLRVKLKPFYSTIGRPSVDPELMIRMLRLCPHTSISLHASASWAKMRPRARRWPRCTGSMPISRRHGCGLFCPTNVAPIRIGCLMACAKRVFLNDRSGS